MKKDLYRDHRYTLNFKEKHDKILIKLAKKEKTSVGLWMRDEIIKIVENIK